MKRMVDIMLVNLNRGFSCANNSKSFGSMWNPDINKKNSFVYNPQKQENNVDENKNVIIIPEMYGREYFVPMLRSSRLSDIQTKSEEEKINKILKTKYGIESNIKDIELLKTMHNAIEDFCEVNGNNDLFKNGIYKLKLEERPFSKLSENGEKEDDKESLVRVKIDNNEFKLIFNSNTDNWVERNKKVTKDEYNAGLINTDNSNYHIYLYLTGFLLKTSDFKSSPIDYNMSISDNNSHTKYYNKDVKKRILKIIRHTDTARYNMAYVSNKMCRVPLPEFFDKLYDCTSDENTKLKLPKIKEEQIHIPESEQSDLEGITKTLKDTYGIDVEFNGNTTYANALLLSVESLVKAADDKNLFSGLNIKVDKKYFNNTFNSGKCIEEDNNGKFFVALNPMLDIESLEDGKKIAYEHGSVATSNVVHSCITHELAHWLQWGHSGDYSYNVTDKGIQFINKYEDGTIDTKDSYSETRKALPNSLNLSSAANVSAYATEDAGEFCSEYIAGKMDGKKYPKSTDVLFETLYRGPKLNFPEN